MLFPILQTSCCFPSYRHHAVSHLRGIMLFPILQASRCFPSYRHHAVSHLTGITLFPILQASRCFPSYRHHAVSHLTGIMLFPILQASRCFPSYRHHAVSHLTDIMLFPILQASRCFPSYRHHAVSHLTDIMLFPILQASRCFPSYRHHAVSHLTGIMLFPILQASRCFPSYRHHAVSHLTGITLFPILEASCCFPSYRHHAVSHLTGEIRQVHRSRTVRISPQTRGFDPQTGRAALEKQESMNANLLQFQKELSRIETELKNEKLKREMLNRELEEAKKTQAPNTPAESFHRQQERRVANILDVCSDTSRPFGVVHSLLPSEDGMTYCVIPRAANTFWLQIYRFINHDFLESRIQSPLDISWKEAHERPFARTKKILWSRLKDSEKQKIQKSKIFFAVQDPYKRLWEAYVDNFRLPRRWNSAGAKIELKRPPKKSAISEGRSLVKACGMDVTFQEFVLFAIKSYENDYDPFYRLCDPCQLQPTYVIREETRHEDTRFVLQHFNLAWVVSNPNFRRDEYLHYINNTVISSMAMFREARTMKCATGGELGRRLWSALEVMGIIPAGTASAPYIDDNTPPDSIIKAATDLFIVAEKRQMDRIGQRRKHLVEAFRSLPQYILDSVKKKYEFDFRLFGYERDPSDFIGPSQKKS
ncbi:hypothetical protein RRG08_041772 [Elysia crispata]|uniref:Carbohydrate sulfotransferase n=1 Tax=Elysia crispata TaxID=231223 RepID=A0AAE0YJ98_9GAST|nr:hypothetical protein RRG08_041772 [Elysia crispata]